MSKKHQPTGWVSTFPSGLFPAQFPAIAEIFDSWAHKCINIIKDCKCNIRLSPAIRFTETIR